MRGQKDQHQGADLTLEAGQASALLEVFYDVYVRPRRGSRWSIFGEGYTWATAHAAASASSNQGSSTAVVPSGELPSAD